MSNREENPEQAEAFNLYWSMGAERGYRSVARKVGKSAATITKWAKKFDWQNRILEMDREAAKRIEAKTLNTVVNQKANFSKLVNNLMVKAVEDIKKDKLKIETISDLEKMVKLWLLLNNQNDSSVKVEHEGEIPAPKPVDGSEISKVLEVSEDARNAVRELFKHVKSTGAGGSVQSAGKN